ncbi:kinase [Plantactinospora sonchi]|uniref:kinase n=1 Tax=Plantactinospora sonchi TaxID=1544735 RepID=UPI0038B4CE3E
MDAVVGSSETKLLVIRGNSGSGKSSIAREVRQRHGRGMALVEQDYLRRVVLRERDVDGGLAPELISQTVRLALRHGYHVVLEGIFISHRYGPMISALRRDHRGDTHVFYLDVSLEETLRRHTLRPQASEFTAEDMRGWYRPRDLLGLPDEMVVPESSSLGETVAFIQYTAGLVAPSPAAG